MTHSFRTYARLRTIYDWYRLSRNRREFLREARGLGGKLLPCLARREAALNDVGRLRTRPELEALEREPCPSLEDLRLRKPNEQTLQ